MKKNRWLKQVSAAALFSTSLFVSVPSGAAAASDTAQPNVVQTAYALVGKPYAYNGTTPAGFDSAGFVSYVQARIIGAPAAKQASPGPVVSNHSSNTGNSVSVQSAATASELGKKIIATGEKFLGVPYKFGAEYETSHRFDCSSFTQYVYKLNGIKLPREARPQSLVGKRIDRKDLRVGDLVFFSTKRTMKYPANSVKRIGHVGIYAGNNRVLHTYGAGGVRYSRMDKGWWNDHYVTAVRVIQ